MESYILLCSNKKQLLEIQRKCIMKNILFTSNKVHTTARIGVLFFSLCFSPLINAGNAEKPMNGIESSETTQQNKIKITGVVTDSKGESIIGANVVEKGTTNGSITDVEGLFNISIAPGAILSSPTSDTSRPK